MSTRVIVAQWLAVLIGMQLALAQSDVTKLGVKANIRELSQRGTADIQAGRLEDAKAAFLIAIRLDPKSTDACENLSFLFLLEGDDTDAYNWATRLLKLEPDSYNGKFVAGIAAINRNRFLRARSFLSSIAVGDGASDPLVIAALVTALRQTGGQAAATRLDAKLSRLSIERHDLLLSGQIFREKELKTLTEKWLETAIRSRPDPADIEVLSMLAGMYTDDGRNADAAALYRRVLAASPNNVNVLVELSEVERKQDDREQSREHLYQAKMLAASDNPTLIRFSQVCMGRHMYVDARDALQKVVAADPHNGEAWYQLGLAQYRLGETDAAGGDFKKALQVNPDDEWSGVGLAAVLLDSGGKREAAAELTRVLKSDPHCSAAYYYLAQVHREEGSLHLAMSELERAVKYSENDARPLAALGQLQLALHDLPSARGSLQKAIQLDPTSATSHYQLAILLRDAGEAEEAKNQIELYKKYHDEENRNGIVGIVRKGEWDYPGFMSPN